MKKFKEWLVGVYGFPTILFIMLAIALIAIGLTHKENPVVLGVDHPVATEVNQAELAAAMERFDLETADSRATVGVEAEPYELVEVGVFTVTWYCPCEKCCGKSDGITATGTQATEGVTVGADWSVFPAGTEIFIEGIGWRIVEDKGGAIKGNTLDVFVNDHQTALDNGRSQHRVFVKEAIS